MLMPIFFDDIIRSPAISFNRLIRCNILGDNLLNSFLVHGFTTRIRAKPTASLFVEASIITGVFWVPLPRLSPPAPPPKKESSISMTPSKNATKASVRSLSFINVFDLMKRRHKQGAILGIGDIPGDGTNQFKAYCYLYNEKTDQIIEYYEMGPVSQKEYKISIDYHDLNQFT